MVGHCHHCKAYGVKDESSYQSQSQKMTCGKGCQGQDYSLQGRDAAGRHDL